MDCDPVILIMKIMSIVTYIVVNCNVITYCINELIGFSPNIHGTKSMKALSATCTKLMLLTCAIQVLDNETETPANIVLGDSHLYMCGCKAKLH